MKRYDYLEAVKADVIDRMDVDCIDITNYSRGLFYGYLYDNLCNDDFVTGNASGSYTFNTWEAEENLCHNLDILAEAMSELGYSSIETLESPETCDVIIRCYLLPQAIRDVLDDFEEVAEELSRKDGWAASAEDVLNELRSRS